MEIQVNLSGFPKERMHQRKCMVKRVSESSIKGSNVLDLSNKNYRYSFFNLVFIKNKTIHF